MRFEIRTRMLEPARLARDVARTSEARNRILVTPEHPLIVACAAPLLAAGLCLSALTSGCGGPVKQSAAPEPPDMEIARLGDPEALTSIRSSFRRNNPGYDIELIDPLRKLRATQGGRFAFIQSGEARARVGGQTSKLERGDLVTLREGDSLTVDGTLSAFVFTTPDSPGQGVPHFIRPDHDPRITDIPGGCATEFDAYRRVCLTWLESVGAYVFHGLNSHRVNIRDSFTHYHPVDGGFDEFYIVQGAGSDARIITSNKRELIESPGELSVAELPSLLRETRLSIGDLVYLPRGVIHRGLGGVLAHVVTVPGFRPGAEIGVDHHLRAINEGFGLVASEAVPFNQAASDAPLVK